MPGSISERRISFRICVATPSGIIETGTDSTVSPKALQKLLGHASLQVTMDTYVHVTDDSKLLAVRQFEGENLNTNGKNGVNGVRTSEKMV